MYAHFVVTFVRQRKWTKYNMSELTWFLSLYNDTVLSTKKENGRLYLSRNLYTGWRSRCNIRNVLFEKTRFFLSKNKFYGSWVEEEQMINRYIFQTLFWWCKGRKKMKGKKPTFTGRRTEAWPILLPWKCHYQSYAYIVYCNTTSKTNLHFAFLLGLVHTLPPCLL